MTHDDDRPELVELRARLRATLDEARPEAVARRRKTGQRTTRENLDDLLDPALGEGVHGGLEQRLVVALRVAAQAR